MTSPYYRPSSYEEQQLYDHLIACRKIEHPEQLLERFRCLFIDGIDYSDSHILVTLHRIATSRVATEEFKFVLHRCSRILINYWWFQPHFRWAIADLVALFQEVQPRGAASNLATQRLRRLVRQFTQTDEYRALQRLAHVVEAGEELDSCEYIRPTRERSSHQANHVNEDDRARSLHKLIHRYPYLYPYCLGEEHSSEQEFEAIRHLQTERQHKFECELSRYVTHLIQQSNGSSRSSTATIKNPTLLSDAKLRTAIKHFTGQVEGNSSYRDLARHFSRYIAQEQSYRTFKDGLYRYLVKSIELVQPNYGKHHFNQWLYTQLKSTLPQSDTQPLNSFLVKRTCQHLIDTLVAGPQNAPNHVVFVDLINNVGATVMVGLLLKLLLLYNNLMPGFESLKSNLEKRFSMLYKHYELVNRGVEWLVESLENLQIAFSIHFGSIKFPCMSQL